eukprot:gb/GFBE01027371.1/.p1 GENE.gb/GFBE01027371.1/~~gb/GFBE01027371.1/.p1  ORF type:complete len:548 (+),score=146.46 gb/GFBE01027371.1/:1-1644(+)
MRDDVVADKAGPVSAGTPVSLLDEVFTISARPDEAAVVLKGGEDMILAASQSGDQRVNVLGLCKVADALVLQNKPTQALEKVGVAKELIEELSFAEGAAVVNYVLARIFVSVGIEDDAVLDKALDFAMDALSSFGSIGSKRGEASALMVLGDVHRALGQEKAVQYYKQASAAFAELGEKSSMGAMQCKLAEERFRTADLRRAAAAAQRGVALFQETREQWQEGSCWRLLAQVQASSKDCAQAKESVSKACSLFKFLKDSAAEASAMEVLVEAYLQTGQYAEGIKVAKEIVTLHHEVGDKYSEVRSLLSLAEHMLRHSDHERAEKVTTVALAMCQRLADKDLLQRCDTLKAACKHARACEEVEAAIWQHRDFLHVPSPLIIDPGRGRRVQTAFEDFAKEIMLEQKLLEPAKPEYVPPPPGQGRPVPQAPRWQPSAQQSPPQAATPADKPLAKTVVPLAVELGLTPAVVTGKVKEIALAVINADDDGEIDADTPLMEAGLTSSAAVRMRDELSQALPGIQLPATLVFDYPSVADMSEFVLKTTGAALGN